MIRIVKGKKIEESDLLEINTKYKKVVVDLGCGYGKEVYDNAKNNPENFYIGIDSSLKSLTEVSFKASRKPSKGGLENILFINSSIETLPNELFGIADEIFINFPWGSLLEGIVKGNEVVLGNIKNLGKVNAVLQVLLTYDSKFEDNFIKERELPNLENEETQKAIINGFDEKGIKVEAFTNISDDLDLSLSSWGKRIMERRERIIYIIKGIINGE